MGVDKIEDFPNDKVGVGLVSMPHERFMLFFPDVMREKFAEIAARIIQFGIFEKVRPDSLDLSIRLSLREGYDEFHLKPSDILMPVVMSIIHEVCGCNHCEQMGRKPDEENEESEVPDEDDMSPEQATQIAVLLSDLFGPEGGL